MKMKKALLLFGFLIIANSIFSQEKYYAQLKVVSKVNGKTKTEINTVSINIDEEYKLVGINTSEPERYKILSQSFDEKTKMTIYNLTLNNGDGTIHAIVSANTEKAILEDLMAKKKIIFDSRERLSIRIN